MDAPNVQPSFSRGNGQMFDKSVISPNVMDVCLKGCECKQPEQAVCCSGFIAPCCVIGATYEMIYSNYTMVRYPCTCKACSSECCCACLAGFFGGNIGLCCFGYFFVHKKLRKSIMEQNELGTCMCGAVEYLFCLPCAMCRDYSTAKNMVQLNQRV
jgi:hypothetical protein